MFTACWDPAEGAPDSPLHICQRSQIQLRKETVMLRTTFQKPLRLCLKNGWGPPKWGQRCYQDTLFWCCLNGNIKNTKRFGWLLPLRCKNIFGLTPVLCTATALCDPRLRLWPRRPQSPDGGAGSSPSRGSKSWCARCRSQTKPAEVGGDRG